MKVYTITGFRGHNPVGTAAVVVANGLDEALDLLNQELRAEGLPELVGGEYRCLFDEVDVSTVGAEILCNGDY